MVKSYECTLVKKVMRIPIAVNRPKFINMEGFPELCM